VARAWLERLTRPLLRRLAPSARIPRDMLLPRLSVRPLRERYPELVRRTNAESRPRVAYFHGCAANYFDDGVGNAVIALLRRQGIEPALPPQRCSGTPIETYGHIDRAKAVARFNLQALEPFEIVVTGCASCTLMLKDYIKFFQDGPERAAAEHLASRVRHISQVVTPAERSPQPNRPRRKVTYHSSCHLRAAGITKEPRQLLAGLPGLEFVEMQDADRCAGGAGTYIIKDHDTARQIFARKREAVEASGAEIVATSCPACLVQLRNELRGSVSIRHIAELLVDAAHEGANRGRAPE
jgi:Fe-S oxidoreductase